MTQCLYCLSEIPEKLNFCLNCEKQVKCLSCSEDLYEGKSKCFVCGEPIQELKLENKEKEQINTYVFKEKKTAKTSQREITLQLTNEAVKNFAPNISHLTNPNGLVPPTMDVDEPIETDKQLPQKSTITEKHHDKKIENNIYEEAKIEHDAEKYFEVEGDFLLLKKRDLKGKKKKDQQERYTVMYGWAYNNLLNKAVPDIEHFKKAAKKENIQDNNYIYKHLQSWLEKYFLKRENGYQLRESGEELVSKIRSEIANSDIIGYDYSKQISKKRNPLNKKDRGVLEEMLKVDTDNNNFEVRSLTAASDFAIFILFEITKKIKLIDNVKPSLGFEYLKKKYATSNVKKAAFVNSLYAKENMNLFKKSSSGGYYLTEESEKMANLWIENGRKENIES